MSGKKNFTKILALISMFGFIVIAARGFFSFELAAWGPSTLLILAGIGLIIVGRLSTIKDWGSDGIQDNEIPFLFAIVFGAITIILGILKIPFFGITSNVVDIGAAFLAAFVIVLIPLQVWVFDRG